MIDKVDSELIKDLTLTEDFYYLLLNNVLKGAFKGGIKGIIKVREGLVLNKAVGINKGSSYYFNGRYIYIKVREL